MGGGGERISITQEDISAAKVFPFQEIEIDKLSAFSQNTSEFLLYCKCIYRKLMDP